MGKTSRTWMMVPAGMCALALTACGKSQQQTYIPPEEAPKFDASKLDAGAASLRLADNAYEKGEYAMAAQLYYRAAELQPDKPDVMTRLGFALFKMGSPGDAEKVFRAALAKNPKQTDALRGLAHSLVLQGRAADAIAHYRLALSANGNDVRLHAGLGAALDMIGRHDEARAVYHNGLKIAPQDFGLRNNLALSYAMSGEGAKARAILGEMTQDPALAPRAQHSLSMINATAVAQRPERKSQVGEIAKPVSAAPKAEPSRANRIDVREDADRDVAAVPAPAEPMRVTRKPFADLPVAESNEGEIFIRTGRANADSRRGPAMSFKSNAATPEDAAAEVLDLLAQAERGPRFVWQEARTPE